MWPLIAAHHVDGDFTSAAAFHKGGSIIMNMKTIGDQIVIIFLFLFFIR
jgi:hypothetical protein